MKEFFESEESYQAYLKAEAEVNKLPLDVIDIDMILSWIFLGE